MADRGGLPINEDLLAPSRQFQPCDPMPTTSPREEQPSLCVAGDAFRGQVETFCFRVTEGQARVRVLEGFGGRWRRGRSPDVIACDLVYIPLWRASGTVHAQRGFFRWRKQVRLPWSLYLHARTCAVAMLNARKSIFQPAPVETAMRVHRRHAGLAREGALGADLAYLDGVIDDVVDRDIVRQRVREKFLVVPDDVCAAALPVWRLRLSEVPVAPGTSVIWVSGVCGQVMSLGL
jgi:hypothetical protein